MKRITKSTVVRIGFEPEKMELTRFAKLIEPAIKGTTNTAVVGKFVKGKARALTGIFAPLAGRQILSDLRWAKNAKETATIATATPPFTRAASKSGIICPGVRYPHIVRVSSSPIKRNPIVV